VAAGDFREDLWFRINTFEVRLPPMRERLEDLEQLARHFVARYGRAAGADDPIFTPEAMEILKSHSWPGNVRELANVIEHALVLCESLPIAPEHLPNRFTAERPSGPILRAAGACSLREMELQAIQDALDRNGGSKPKAAEDLGISLKTLYNKLNQTTSMSKSA
jgi:DNA-binding NtrC family response regulator